MNFKDLGLQPELLSAISAHGYSTPTPIQVEAIPPVLAGRDLLAGAQTGTGKTAAFVLPLLQLLGAAAGRGPRALVLAPTRELAAQILESIRVYGANKKLRSRVIFGGVGERPQIDGLRIGCDILVATPGRLLDLANRGLANLSEVQHLVLDEADRMLDMGFIHDIRRIIKLLPSKRQNLMFSATYTPDIRALAARILVNPVQVEVTPPNSTVDRVVQLAFASRRTTSATSSCTSSSTAPMAKAAGNRPWCSRARSTARTGWPTSSAAPASAPLRFTATRVRPRAPARSPTSRPAN